MGRNRSAWQSGLQRFVAVATGGVLVLTGLLGLRASDPCAAHEHDTEMLHQHEHFTGVAWTADGATESCPHCPDAHCDEQLPCQVLVQYAVLPSAAETMTLAPNLTTFPSPQNARFTPTRLPPLPPPRPVYSPEVLRA